MSYAVTVKEGKYDLLEKSSDVLIELNYEEKKANDICRKLNLGGGFNGWTPPFFAIKYNEKGEA